MGLGVQEFEHVGHDPRHGGLIVRFDMEEVVVAITVGITNGDRDADRAGGCQVCCQLVIMDGGLGGTRSSLTGRLCY